MSMQCTNFDSQKHSSLSSTCRNILNPHVLTSVLCNLILDDMSRLGTLATFCDKLTAFKASGDNLMLTSSSFAGETRNFCVRFNFKARTAMKPEDEMHQTFFEVIRFTRSRPA